MDNALYSDIWHFQSCTRACVCVRVRMRVCVRDEAENTSRPAYPCTFPVLSHPVP